MWNKLFWIVAGVTIMSLLGTAVAFSWLATAEAMRAPIIHRAPTPELRPSVKYGWRPMPPISLINGELDVAARLEWLIESHPLPLIHRHMVSALENGELVLQLMPASPGHIAEFQTGYRQSDQQPVGIMVINPNWVAQLNSDDDTLYGMLVILHEFVHYNDWKVASGAELEMWMVSPTLSPAPAGWCLHSWKVERHAYWLEATVGHVWGGVPKLQPLIDVVKDDTLFNATLLATLLESPTAKIRPECVAVWQEAAKH